MESTKQWDSLWIVRRFFICTNDGWATGNSGEIIHTTDGGSTWFVQFVEDSIYLSGIYFTDEDNGTVVGGGIIGSYYSAIILRTTNSGVTWNLQYSGVNQVLGEVFFIDNNVGWASGEYGTIIHTTDSGATWNLQPRVTNMYLFSINFISPDKGWAVGNQGTMLYTSDGGNNWIKHSPTFNWNRILYSVHFSDENNGTTVGNNGTILRTTNGGLTFIESDEEENSIPIEYLISQNYPNPFIPSTTITYQIPQTGFVTLKVYDILGREVATLVNEEKLAGRYEVQFSGNGLTSGIYFYQLKVYPANGGAGDPLTSSGQGNSETKKMILLR